MSASEDDRAALLAGLIDSDGSLDPRGQYTFVQSVVHTTLFEHVRVFSQRPWHQGGRDGNVLPPEPNGDHGIIEMMQRFRMYGLAFKLQQHIALPRKKHRTTYYECESRTIGFDGRTRLCLPESMIREVLQDTHDRMGHPGIGKTSVLILDTFFRPGLTSRIRELLDCQEHVLHPGDDPLPSTKLSRDRGTLRYGGQRVHHRREPSALHPQWRRPGLSPEGGEHQRAVCVDPVDAVDENLTLMGPRIEAANREAILVQLNGRYIISAQWASSRQDRARTRSLRLPGRDVGDLIASPRILYKFWLVNPLELFIWLAAVLVSVFSSLENGVYTSVGASVALLLIRIAHPRGRWLGTVRIHHGDSPETTQADHREVFVPLDDRDGLRDPSIQVVPPPPGVLIYRFEEAFTYPNASGLADSIIEHAKESTRPGTANNSRKPGDRPWNDPGPVNPWLAKAVRPILFGKAKRGLDVKLSEALDEVDPSADPRPMLRAFVFDFSGVSNVDTTSIQTLVDVRLALERYTGSAIEFHFANILSPWIRRALLAGGFGTGSSRGRVTEIAPVVPRRGGSLTGEEQAIRDIEAHTKKRQAEQESGATGGDAIDAVYSLGKEGSGERDGADSNLSSTNKERLAEEGYDDDGADGHSAASVPVLWGQDLTPFFHLDLSAALAAATYAVRR
ncbi:unnamed protein product [Parajaminaea phylloscopi]